MHVKTFCLNKHVYVYVEQWHLCNSTHVQLNLCYWTPYTVFWYCEQYKF